MTTGRESREVRAEDFHLGFFTTHLDERRADRVGPGACARAGLGLELPGGLQARRRLRDGFRGRAGPQRGGLIVEARVAVGGVSDRPVRLADVEVSPDRLRGWPTSVTVSVPSMGSGPLDDTRRLRSTKRALPVSL